MEGTLRILLAKRILVIPHSSMYFYLINLSRYVHSIFLPFFVLSYDFIFIMNDIIFLINSIYKLDALFTDFYLTRLVLIISIMSSGWLKRKKPFHCPRNSRLPEMVSM